MQYRWSILTLAAPAAVALTHFAFAKSEPVAPTHAHAPAPFVVATSSTAPTSTEVFALTAPPTPEPVVLRILEPEREQAPISGKSATTAPSIPIVPFYSQFADISDPSWRKLGCGIASVAMLIDHHTDAEVSVDTLLARGIDSGAYLQNAGWKHAGLVNLARPYGLSGGSVGLHHLSADAALMELKHALRDAPVMASVHYTFEPTNPIPHLVVITGIDGDTVHYNDPAAARGGGTLSVEKFQPAWKQRYIELRPVDVS